MPEAYLFVPCEKVLIDPVTNQWSVVSILDSMQPLAERELEDNDHPLIMGTRYLLAPFHIATQWGRSEVDGIEEYEHSVYIQAPDGRETLVGQPMSISHDRPVHRVIQQAHITCRMTGTYILVLKFKKLGDEVSEIAARFPIMIEDVVVPMPSFAETEARALEAAEAVA